MLQVGQGVVALDFEFVVEVAGRFVGVALALSEAGDGMAGHIGPFQVLKNIAGEWGRVLRRTCGLGSHETRLSFMDDEASACWRGILGFG